MRFRTKFFTSKQKSGLEELSNIGFMESPSASLILDEKATILQVNKSFSELTGYSHDEAINKPVSFLKSGEHDHKFYKNLWHSILNHTKHEFEIYNRCKNGNQILVKEKIKKLSINGNNYFISIMEDITEHKKIFNRHMHLATHDPLTGISNRLLFEDRISHAIKNAARSSKKVALIMCDLNEFKDINDTYGHNFGDEALKEVAKTLQTSIREVDTVCRYGGDEFVILLEQIHSRKEVEDIINKIKLKFPLLVTKKEKQCHVAISIGYSIFPEHGTNYEQLFTIADSKMYDSKNHYYGRA
nr:sensor domain-containing diguanylate cyclase [uncultured Sulfurimonas sp.]